MTAGEYFEEGFVAYGNDDYNRAIAYCNKTIELDGNYAYAYNNRGNAKVGLRYNEEAFKDYDSAITLLKLKNDIERKINEMRQDVTDGLDALKRDAENLQLDTDTVYKLPLNLRYLVKHSAFKGEQECGIIQIKKLIFTDKDIKPSENGSLYMDCLPLNAGNVEKPVLCPKRKAWTNSNCILL